MCRADQGGRLAKERIDARGGDSTIRLTRHNRRTHLANVALAHLHRQRLARHRGLVDLDLHPRVDAAVGRHVATSRERHAVPRHQQRCIDFAPHALALDRRDRLERRLESGHRVARAQVLPETDGAVEEEEGEQGAEVGPLL